MAANQNRDTSLKNKRKKEKEEQKKKERRGKIYFQCSEWRTTFITLEDHVRFLDDTVFYMIQYYLGRYFNQAST